MIYCQPNIQTFNILIIGIDVKHEILQLDAILGLMHCLMGSLHEIIEEEH